MRENAVQDATGDAQAAPKRALPNGLADIGLDHFAPYLMNRIMGRYNASLREEMAKLELTTAQMRVLAILSVREGILMRELAIFAVVEQSTLSRALDRLERDGQVQRATDPHDSRAIRVTLTEAGRQSYEQLWPQMAKSYARMFEGIPQEEREAFVGTLQKVLRNVRVNEV